MSDEGEVVPYHNPNIVAELEALLEHAKQGKILCFSYCAKRKAKDRWFRNSFGDDHEGMAGSILALVFDLIAPDIATAAEDA